MKIEFGSTLYQRRKLSLPILKSHLDRVFQDPRLFVYKTVPGHWWVRWYGNKEVIHKNLPILMGEGLAKSFLNGHRHGT